MDTLSRDLAEHIDPNAWDAEDTRAVIAALGVSLGALAFLVIALRGIVKYFA